MGVLDCALCAAAAVSDCDSKGFLHHGTIVNQIKRKSSRNTHKKKKEKKWGLYHSLPKELQVTLMMTCMEVAPETRKLIDAALIRSREWQEQKEALAREKGLEDEEDEFIESSIYHKMGHSDVHWATAGNGMSNRLYS